MVGNILGPMVWYQKFEYAVGHWLQKSCEHIFGSVLCCPGCFSVFRASALVDDNVLKTYTREPEEGKHLIQFEQGEDRWLCTLLLKRGYKIDYCAASDAKTFAPDNFWDFFIQRRRWSPSTMANMIDLVKSWGEVVHNNPEINHMFMLYQAVLLITNIFAPGAVIIVIVGAFSSVMDFRPWQSFFVALSPVVFFAIICLKTKQKTQLLVAAILSTGYTFIMVIVTIGMVISIATNADAYYSPNVLFLAFVAATIIIAACLHPNEFSCLFHGILYYASVPSTFIFLSVFYMCNLNDVSWGTRETKPASEIGAGENSKSSVVKSILDLLLQFVRKRLSDSDGRGHNQNPPLPKTLPNEDEVAKTDHHHHVHWHNQLKDFNFKSFRLNEEEKDFWKEQLEKHLKPLENNTKLQERFTAELNSLRNNVVYVFFVMNTMLAIAMLQLQVKKDSLTSYYIDGKYEPLSVIFLSIYGSLLLIQFIFMLFHRWRTFSHLISSTDIFGNCCSKTDRRNYKSFLDEVEEMEIELEEELEEIHHNDEPPPDYETEPEADYSDDETDETDISPRSVGNQANAKRMDIYRRRLRTLRYKNVRQMNQEHGSIDSNAFKYGRKYHRKLFRRERIYEV